MSADTCHKCGALVEDWELHNDWHTTLNLTLTELRGIAVRASQIAEHADHMWRPIG